MKTDVLNRRDFMKTSGLAIVAAGLGGCATAGATQANGGSDKRSKRSVRIAHLTDIHVQREKNADAWLARCLQHVQQQDDAPQFILNGGDVIMDSLQADAARTRAQWEVMRRVFAAECSTPIIHCVGNHDVWGWDKEKSGASPEDVHYGKAWALEMLALQRGYYSTPINNWHLIVLDSTHPGANRMYDAKLDEEQFQWLERELASTPVNENVLVLSHIPIVSACAYFDGDNEKPGDWHVPGSWMHIDARRIKDLFAKYPNVKLALSGHIHLLDRVDYNGVTYLCNGAVCGNWWKGSYQETPPGYALIDLFDDGSFDYKYVTYGWTEQA